MLAYVSRMTSKIISIRFVITTSAQMLESRNMSEGIQHVEIGFRAVKQHVKVCSGTRRVLERKDGILDAGKRDVVSSAESKEM